MPKRVILLMILFWGSTVLWAGDNYLRGTKMVGDTLELRFKFPVTHVNYFILPSKNMTKYIYDVQGGVLPVGKTLPYTHQNVQAFRIGQYTKEVLRIVIESSSANSKKHRIEGNKLIIPLPTGKKLYPSKSLSKKSVSTKKGTTAKGPRVVIDAGHGGKDSGASCCSVKEKKIALEISKKLQKKLQVKGYRVYMTRTRDKFVPLIKRTEYGNGKKADIFISIHANAAPSKKRKRLNGIEIFYLNVNHSKRVKRERILYKGRTVYGKYSYRLMTHKKKIDRSKKLAQNVQRYVNRSIHKGYQRVNSDIKRADFWVLLGTKMPSILVEAGYLTHKRDLKRLESGYYQNLLVQGIAQGVDRYFSGK